MGEPHVSTRLLCTDKFHLNKLMQCVDLSIKLLPIQTNTHTNPTFCYGPEPGVSSTGGCSGSTYALTPVNSLQLILSVTFCTSGSKL